MGNNNNELMKKSAGKIRELDQKIKEMEKDAIDKKKDIDKANEKLQQANDKIASLEKENKCKAIVSGLVDDEVIGKVHEKIAFDKLYNSPNPEDLEAIYRATRNDKDGDIEKSAGRYEKSKSAKEEFLQNFVGIH